MYGIFEGRSNGLCPVCSDSATVYVKRKLHVRRSSVVVNEFFWFWWFFDHRAIKSWNVVFQYKRVSHACERISPNTASVAPSRPFCSCMSTVSLMSSYCSWVRLKQPLIFVKDNIMDGFHLRDAWYRKFVTRRCLTELGLCWHYQRHKKHREIILQDHHLEM